MTPPPDRWLAGEAGARLSSVRSGAPCWPSRHKHATDCVEAFGVTGCCRRLRHHHHRSKTHCCPLLAPSSVRSRIVIHVPSPLWRGWGGVPRSGRLSSPLLLLLTRFIVQVVLPPFGFLLLLLLCGCRRCMGVKRKRGRETASRPGSSPTAACARWQQANRRPLGTRTVVLPNFRVKAVPWRRASRDRRRLLLRPRPVQVRVEPIPSGIACRRLLLVRVGGGGRPGVMRPLVLPPRLLIVVAALLLRIPALLVAWVSRVSRVAVVPARVPVRLRRVPLRRARRRVVCPRSRGGRAKLRKDKLARAQAPDDEDDDAEDVEGPRHAAADVARVVRRRLVEREHDGSSLLERWVDWVPAGDRPARPLSQPQVPVELGLLARVGAVVPARAGERASEKTTNEARGHGG